MQELSFDFRDPVFVVGGWRLSLQVTTFENTYGVAAAEAVESGDDLEVMVVFKGEAGLKHLMLSIAPLERL